MLYNFLIIFFVFLIIMQLFEKNNIIEGLETITIDNSTTPSTTSNSTDVEGKIVNINTQIGQLTSTDNDLQKQITDLSGQLITIHQQLNEISTTQMNLNSQITPPVDSSTFSI